MIKLLVTAVLATGTAALVTVVIVMDVNPLCQHRQTESSSGQSSPERIAAAIDLTSRVNESITEPSTGANSRESSDESDDSFASGSMLNKLPSDASAQSDGPDSKHGPGQTAAMQNDSLFHSAPAARTQQLSLTEPIDPVVDALAFNVDEYFSGATVQIENVAVDAVGSGVVISIGRTSVEVLTANHVVASAMSTNQVPELVVQWASTQSGTPGPFASLTSLRPPNYKAVRILYSDRDADLALLRVEMPGGTDSARTVRIHEGDVSVLSDLVGRTVWAIDTTSGDAIERIDCQIDALQIARISAATPANKFFRLDRSSKLGMSGSGLFLPDFEDGEPRLIGIASGNSEKKAFYVASCVIRDFLNVARSSGR